MEIKAQFLAVVLGIVLVMAAFSTAASGFAEPAETDLVLVSLGGENDVTSIERAGGEILQEYPNRALVKLPEKSQAELHSAGIDIESELPARTELSVKGHRFDTNEGMPDFPKDLTIDDYESGEEGIYLVQMIGPVHAEWRAKLEARGLEIINYVPNYAYEVRMTPEWADRVENLDFVDWVDVYQPGFKVANDIEPGLLSVTFSDGGQSVVGVNSEDQIVKLANQNDVYYIDQFDEPELHDEMATQIIGGGLWVMDDDDNPDTAYRANGDYGSYANQLGYEGSGHVTAIADTGLGDGTTPDAGHQDFTGRVVGGYSYTSDGSWADDNGHGTHCAGSVGGDTYHGTGEKYYNDYYSAQGSAPSTEYFSVRIFDGNGNWVGPDDYHEIVEVALKNSDTYVHSNSWGSSGDGAYADSDEDFDRAVRDGNRDTAENEPVVITVAAGNDGPGAMQGGGYNSIGSPGNAKNVITIGSVQNYNPNEGVDDPEAVSGFSSRGWTDDNRVKPDVMAPGEGIYSTDPNGGYQAMSGTSMANPAVAGAAGVVVDWYEQQYGVRPNPSMVKALLINNAYSLANTQSDTGENSPYIPNQDEGWGLVNLPTIVDAPVNMVLKDETSLLTTGDVDEYSIEYDDASVPLNITLTWTDDEALAGDDPTLKNDLNLELVSPSGAVYRGNNLVESWSVSGEGTYDTFDSSGDGWDDSNNVENINLHTDDMETGTYTVRVIGHDVPADANNDGTANQDYSLVMYNAIEGSSSDNTAPSVDLTRPDGGETFQAGDVETIWWNMSDNEDANTDLTVDLYYSTDGGGSWNAIDTGLAGEANPNSYDWTVPDDPSTDCLVKADVTDTNGATSSDQSQNTFTIEGTTPPSITITRPSGGETWNAGDVEEITWDTTSGDGTITGVDLEYSVDDGASYSLIVEGTEDDGSYNWTVPDEDTDQARIRATVYDDNDLSGEDVSDQFTINGTSGSSAPEINTFQLTDTSNPQWARVDVDWGVSDSDGDLDSVKIEMVDSNGNVVDSVTNSVSGDSASGTNSLRDRSSGGTYDIVLTVTDAEGNTTQQTKTIEL